MTMLELLIVLCILCLLATVVMPMVKHGAKRTLEIELKQKLREMRTAIDEFKRDWARDGELMTGPLCVKNKLTCKEVTGVTGYPKSMKTLLGVELSGGEAGTREVKSIRRYLRRIPLDPMTASDEWGLRCYQDPPEAKDWCREDVFEVFSRSDDLALNKTKYREW